MFLKKFREGMRNLFLRAFVTKSLWQRSYKCKTEDEKFIKCDASVTVGEGKIVTAKCGHSSYENYSIDFLGSNISCHGEIKCPRCVLTFLRENSTFCAMCGGVVIPGEEVALYHKVNHLPFKAKAKKVGNSFIGCLGWECCPSGGLFAGHWMGNEEGFVIYDFEKMRQSEC